MKNRLVFVLPADDVMRNGLETEQTYVEMLQGDAVDIRIKKIHAIRFTGDFIYADMTVETDRRGSLIIAEHAE